MNSFLNHSDSWDIRSMFSGYEDGDIANEVATFFNRISNEYPPLDVSAVPTTFSEPIPDLTTEDVIKLLQDSKKPKSGRSRGHVPGVR